VTKPKESTPTSKPKIASQENLKASLPEAGEDRWWRVIVKPGSGTAAPMEIALMECQRPGSKALSRVLNSARAVATVQALAEAAERILVQVGDYEKLQGDYGI
jgi:hypothetical protein